MDALGRMVLQVRQHVSEPGQGICVIELGGVDQGVDGGGAPAALVGAGEGPVAAADRDAAQGPLGGALLRQRRPPSRKRTRASSR